MDKNIIKKYLAETFLTEEKKGGKDNDGKLAKVADTSKATQEKKSAKGTQGVPGVKVTAKVNKETATSNKAGIKAIEKDMKEYEKPLKADANAKEMAPNKFNFKDKEEETYHDEMENMNGMEMLQYDRTPDERFKERALEAIEGSSKMGNNPEWANVVEKGWGGDKEFGKNLAKKIKDSGKKRSAETPTFYMHGRDNSVDIKDTGHRPYALESITNKKRIVRENFMEGGEYDVTVKSMDSNNFTAVVYTEQMSPDEDGYVVKGNYYADSESHEPESLYHPGNQGGLLYVQADITHGYKTINGQKAPLTDEEIQMLNSDKRLIQILDDNLYNEHERKSKDWGPEPDFDLDENKKTNKPLIGENKNKKQPMKRLKFKKEFKGVANALRMIPESYRVDSKVFEMTDGNESYKIRWEGSLNEGAAVVLTASDKKMVNEDMQKMKHLFNYKSEDTLGLVKGKNRVDENATFADIYAKTKKLLSETEDIEGQTADSEGEWDDAGITQAADAKKHVQGSVSTEKGTQAPAPKEGHWDKIKIHAAASPTGGSKGSTPKAEAKVGDASKAVKQAPEAKKHVEGSVSTEKGTQAPAPKNGEWDKVKKSAPEATKDITGSKKK